MFDCSNFWSQYSVLLTAPSPVHLLAIRGKQFFKSFSGDEVVLLRVSFFDIILISKLLWIFNDWKFSVIQLIFCHKTSLVSRTPFFPYLGWWGRCVVCTLSLSHFRGEMLWGQDYHQPYNFLQNRHFTKYNVSFYIKNFICQFEPIHRFLQICPH